MIIANLLECLDNIDKSIRKLKLKGLNVTIPFKKEIKYVEKLINCSKSSSKYYKKQ